MSGRVFELKGNQREAVDPQGSVWLSASAGTGKTQVLSARVLRLLLRPDVRPEDILCLTFTKAGAAEMATRVNEVLANWVRIKPEALATDLLHIGADNSPETQARARTLFANVLDCPGGGLRIDTIHAFAQWLLAAFPEEAGIEPGTQPMEDRDREVLSHKVLAELLVQWDERGEREAIEALEMLSLRMGADGAREWLMRCAEARAAWFGPGAWQPPLRSRVMGLFGLPAETRLEDVAALCADDVFECGELRRCLSTLEDWDTAAGREGAEAIRTWLALTPDDRLQSLKLFSGTLFNKSDFDTPQRAPKQLKNILKRNPDYEGSIGRVSECLTRALEMKTLLDLVETVAPALDVGRRFALAWEEAKKREGLVDFDDLIRRAAGLLANDSLGAWIRYKLDRRFDHILVDEAQDTNEAQWSIIRALSGDFFTGEGQRGDKLRTIFVVGDYKQAIFGFQGTSPQNFTKARREYAREIDQWAQNARQLAAQLREPEPQYRPLKELGLGRSYRTAQPILDFVDEAIEAIGPEQFGLGPDEAPEPHKGDDRAGLVTLWNPILARPGDDEDSEDEGPEGWVSEPERRMADKIAAQVREWMDRGYPLVKGKPRNAGPGDVMVLVRKRRELAGLIVARLHAAGVPVAGVDRLRLGAPLAVKDLMAALRFAAQPGDDLSLACLLVSPIFGWSQQQLLDHGYREKGRLWDHLHRSEHPEARQAVEMLLDMLRRADFEPPQALLHWILLGPWSARRKLVARLGREIEDPIDELLNAALAYSSSNTPSLQGFIQWFDAGEGELKRDAGEAGDQVRVMTVHGSKGLQAPIVILADATGNPDASRTRGLELEEELPGGGGRKLPLPDLRKEEKVGRIAEAEARAAASEREEHWRLLYVAMTRAEEALFIGGALGKREKEPAPDSWYGRLAPLFDGIAETDDIWGARKERGVQPEPVPMVLNEGVEARVEIPSWARAPVGPEPKPPRPLAPSSAGEEGGADPPLPPESAAFAARRGVLIHALLERLPDIGASEREDRGREWLARQAGDVPAEEREDMLAKALAVIAEPEWAELFSPDALAEVPLAATVGEQVVAGTADRLLVQHDRVLVADFKTARRPPASLEEVPASTLRQMGAYAAALEVIFPGKAVEAALLYTQTPRLIAIPGELLAANKPALAPKQESYAG